MAILVDELQRAPKAWTRYGNRLYCHMMTDNRTPDGLTELHEFARALGLREEWFQPDPRHPHYDLTPGKRALAVRFGAEEVSSKELLRRCAWKVAGQGEPAPPAAAWPAWEEGGMEGGRMNFKKGLDEIRKEAIAQALAAMRAAGIDPAKLTPKQALQWMGRNLRTGPANGWYKQVFERPPVNQRQAKAFERDWRNQFRNPALLGDAPSPAEGGEL